MAVVDGHKSSPFASEEVKKSVLLAASRVGKSVLAQEYTALKGLLDAVPQKKTPDEPEAPTERVATVKEGYGNW